MICTLAQACGHRPGSQHGVQVPWGVIARQPELFFPPGIIPAGVVFNEPRHMNKSHVGPLWDEIIRRQELPDKAEHFHWVQIVVNDMPAATRYDDPVAAEEVRALKSKKRRKTRTREAPRAKKQHVGDASDDDSHPRPPKGKQKSRQKQKGNQKRKSREREDMQTTTDEDSTEEELDDARKIDNSKAGPSSARPKRGPAPRAAKKAAPVAREAAPEQPSETPGSPGASPSTSAPAAANADLSAAQKVPVPPPEDVVARAKHQPPVWALKNKNPFAYLWALTQEPEYRRLLISWRHMVCISLLFNSRGSHRFVRSPSALCFPRAAALSGKAGSPTRFLCPTPTILPGPVGTRSSGGSPVTAPWRTALRARFRNGS